MFSIVPMTFGFILGRDKVAPEHLLLALVDLHHEGAMRILEGTGVESDVFVGGRC